MISLLWMYQFDYKLRCPKVNKAGYEGEGDIAEGGKSSRG